MMNIAGYELDLLVIGFPGKGVCHGGLGWSTIALLRGHGRVALIDTGPIGMRRLLRDELRRRGVAPADVTDLLLTHSHHDHSINWTLFPQARIGIGSHELDWSLKQPWGETPVPELYMRELSSWPRLHRLADGEEALPHLSAHVAPGHTPGHLIFVLQDAQRDVIFTGDAAKNRAELVSRHADMSYDQSVTAASIEHIWSYWRRKPGSVVVPGHDLPMTQEEGQTRYLMSRKAQIEAFFGDSLDEPTLIDLTEAGQP